MSIAFRVRPSYVFPVTERARKLRAQYALQAQSLRTRIELRVNRIPTTIRKANMGELYEKYLESTKQPLNLETNSNPQSKPTDAPSTSKPSDPTLPPQRGTKRPSDHFSADDDKENTPDPTHPLSTKKRPRPNNAHPSAVLSPKSPNPRAQGPIRPQLGSPQKSYVTHTNSPLKPGGEIAAPKPSSPAKAAAVVATAAASLTNTTTQKSRATRTRAAAGKPAKAPTKAAGLRSKAAPTTRTKRGVEPSAAVVRNESRTVSAASNTSTGTTVVRKVGKGAGAGSAVTAKGKGKEGLGKTVGRKGAAAALEAPAQGRRVLRKRG